MKEMLKNAGILLAITVIAGFILGAVCQITKGPIAEAEAAAAMEAYKEVFADASDFTEIEVNANALAEGGITGSDIDKVMEAKGADGAVLGYVFVITNHEGYAGDIQFTLGVSNDGTTNGISILAISETPGLGMKAVEPAFIANFEGKNVSEFVVVKTAPTAENEIEAIAGSTITTDAVANAVNAAIVYAQSLVGGAQ